MSAEVSEADEAIAGALMASALWCGRAGYEILSACLLVCVCTDDAPAWLQVASAATSIQLHPRRAEDNRANSFPNEIIFHQSNSHSSNMMDIRLHARTSWATRIPSFGPRGFAVPVVYICYPPPVIYHFRPMKPNLTVAAVKS